MADQRTTPVAAKWAWITVEPGAGDAVGIQATSDSITDFDELTALFATGSPSSTPDAEAPDAPPWVTFGPVWSEGEPLLSVAVRDPWQQPNPAKRPVSPRRFFLCRFADLARAEASYQTIWQVIGPVLLPRELHQEVELRVRYQPVEDLVRVIDLYGFNRLALVAAVLLETRVVVQGAASLGRDGRLALVDAVAALLPYGFRADLSASSGVKETVTHEIRLVFADFVSSDDQLLVSLRGAEPQLAPGVALAYLDMLREKERISGLHTVVEHLWRANHACTFRQPEDALDVLAKLEPIQYFVALLGEYNLTREHVRPFFRQPETVVRRTWDHPNVSDEMRDRALGLFLARQDDEETGVLYGYWETLIGSVARLGLRWLGQGDPDGVGWLLRVARNVPDEAEDDLLARLIAGEQAYSGEVRTDALVGLLLNRPAPPAPDALRASRDELRGVSGGTGHESLVKQLLVSEINGRDGSPGAVKWAQWLCRTSLAERRTGLRWPDWMNVLSCVLGEDHGQFPFTTISELIRRDPDWAVALRLAGQTGRLNEILRAIWADLVEIAVQLAPQHGWGNTLADALSIDSPTLATDVIAVVDAVRVLLGQAPGPFLLHTDQPSFGPYDRSLKAVFGLQVAQSAGSLLERGFLDHVIRTDSLPHAAIWLMRSWAADGYRAPGLARYVVDKRIAGVMLQHDELDDALWKALIKYQPDLEAFALGPILRSAARRTIEQPTPRLHRARVSRAVPATELADVMCEAFISGMRVAEILRVLRSSTADGRNLTSIDPEELDKVLLQFQGLLFYDRRRDFEDASVRALLEFYGLISSGALGPAFGRTFARRVKKILRGQIRSRRKAIRVLSRGARKRFRPPVRESGARRGTHGVPARHVPSRKEGAGGAG